MGTTEDKLLYLLNTKEEIRNSIIAKGVDIPSDTTFRNYASKIGQIAGAGGLTPEPWIRPTEWLPLPDNINGVQKVSILNAVFNTDSEFVAFNISGNCKIDWGDGTSNTYTGGQASMEHKYDYNNPNLNTNTVSKFGYKQCIITITPATANDNLTNLCLNYYYSLVGNNYNSPYPSAFLDMHINAANCTILKIGSHAGSSAYVRQRMLEHVKIGEMNITDAIYLFYDMPSLLSVEILSSSSSKVTSWSCSFYKCNSLQEAPEITFNPAGVIIDNMYNGCYKLIKVPDIYAKIEQATGIQYLFNNCFSLQTVKLVLELYSSNTSFEGIFYNCYSLYKIDIELSGSGYVGSLSSAFRYCRALPKHPIFDTSKVHNWSNAFEYSGILHLGGLDFTSALILASICAYCFSLLEVDDLNMPSCTTATSAFYSCQSLKRAPHINAPLMNNIGTMYINCSSMVFVPAYNFPLVVTGSNLSSFLNGCQSLSVVPKITLGNYNSSNTNFITGCNGLKRMLTPLKYTFSILNSKMSANALSEMYSILPTVLDAAPTVTVSGNPGATLFPLISKSGVTTTTTSKTITMADTSGLSVGMYAIGSGALSTTDAGVTGEAWQGGSMIQKANHSLIVGDIVSFNIVNTSGLPLKTIMYVVEVVDANNFKVSLTPGGPVFTIAASATVAYNTPAFITNIVPNVSVTLSTFPIAAGSFTIIFRSNEHKTYIATMKNWTVSG